MTSNPDLQLTSHGNRLHITNNHNLLILEVIHGNVLGQSTDDCQWGLRYTSGCGNQHIFEVCIPDKCFNYSLPVPTSTFSMYNESALGCYMVMREILFDKAKQFGDN